MFVSTYKVTLKNLIRSKTFWLVLAVLLINTIHESLEGFYADDDSPEMILSFAEYIPCIVNSCCSHFLMYAMPIFTIITTVLVVNRDYGDHPIYPEVAAIQKMLLENKPFFAPLEDEKNKRYFGRSATKTQFNRLSTAHFSYSDLVFVRDLLKNQN